MRLLGLVGHDDRLVGTFAEPVVQVDAVLFELAGEDAFDLFSQPGDVAGSGDVDLRAERPRAYGHGSRDVFGMVDEQSVGVDAVAEFGGVRPRCVRFGQRLVTFAQDQDVGDTSVPACRSNVSLGRRHAATSSALRARPRRMFDVFLSSVYRLVSTATRPPGRTASRLCWMNQSWMTVPSILIASLYGTLPTARSNASVGSPVRSILLLMMSSSAHRWRAMPALIGSASMPVTRRTIRPVWSG